MIVEQIFNLTLIIDTKPVHPVHSVVIGISYPKKVQKNKY